MSEPTFADDVRTVSRVAWWALLLRGLLLVVLAILLLVTPVGDVLVTFAVVYGAFALADGIMSLIIGLQHKGVPGRGWAIFTAVVSILAGIVAIAWPGITALVLLLIVGIWAIFAGVGEILGSFGLRRLGVRSWWWMLIGGILLAILGGLLLVQPDQGAIVLVTWIAIFLIATGIAEIASAFVLRSAAKGLTR